MAPKPPFGKGTPYTEVVIQNFHKTFFRELIIKAKDNTGKKLEDITYEDILKILKNELKRIEESYE